MNYDLFNSLSNEDQKIIMDAALAEQDEEYMQKCRDYGIEVIEFTPEELDKLRDIAVEELWPELYSTIGKKIIDEASAYAKTLK